MDEMAGEAPASKAPMSEQRTDATEPRQSETTGDKGIIDEHSHLSTVQEGKKPAGGPALKENTPPKSILKKTVGTAAERRQMEGGGSASGQANDGEQRKDNSEGVRLFRESVARLRASECDSTPDDASGPAGECHCARPVPRLIMRTEAGALAAGTNGNAEPAFHPPDGGEDRSGCKEMALRHCDLM